MAGGFTKDGAVQEQIDASIDDAVKQVRSRLPEGKSLSECAICGEPIPEKRRQAIPGVRLCITCQQEEDAQQKINVGYNRRGSKGSQMK
jgi:phage/conjugal plasmid C-4 type zinc finger TraR family protein